MNIQQLRQSLKMKWLNYYHQNRSWLVKMRVWGTYNGLRRPSSGYILATLSVLEPEFEQMLAFMMDLNNNPDAIVTALGLNFNPEEELRLTNLDTLAQNQSYKKSPEVMRLEEKPLRLAPGGEMIAQPLVKLPMTEKIPTDVPQVNKPLSAFAVAPRVTLQSSAKALQAVQLSPNGVSTSKPVRALALTTTVPSNGKTIALAIEVPSQGKSWSRRIVANSQTSLAAMPISNTTAPERPNQVNSVELKEHSQVKTKTGDEFSGIKPAMSSEAYIKYEIPNYSALKSIPQTNARSLASWVDEFCQGKAWNYEP
ncbi:DUF5331 domain-containing protein [Nostoc sp. FACHB-110]|uniref:DUF5331 domain-containing protein n=1 Tax=Nostoc sp. FACHB-110 TaxID=2692834 RepID=UPI0016856BDB|nr:DUF5331 domain-containing protein [Nostoc sp. FACHB-110]MBD2440613.1 hypothetical protein [Nostoc sp. FACHB-110]